MYNSALISEALANQNNEYEEVLEPSDLKLRPIVAGPTCLTRPWSDLLDNIVKPLIFQVKSYVRDNIDFVECYSRVNNESTNLATFLYTNIPHAYRLKALPYRIDKYSGSVHQRFSKQFVLEWARLILEKNNCKFNDEIFVQINGTAMGIIFTLTYGTISIGFFEVKIYRYALINLFKP